MQYDAANRLLGATVNGQETTFVYDGDGGRVKKSFNGTTTVYIGKLYECTNGSCVKYIFGGSERLALKSTDSATPYFYHSDHAGSTGVVTQQDGAIFQYLAYFPYGEIWTNSLAPASGLHHKFTGQELDDSIALYFYNARYYDPIIGRFVSPDNLGGGIIDLTQTTEPQKLITVLDLIRGYGRVASYAHPNISTGYSGNPENPHSLNRYSYVYNNPLRYTDPTGEQAQLIPIIIGVGIGAVQGGTSALAAGNGPSSSGFWGSVAIGAGTGGLTAAYIEANPYLLGAFIGYTSNVLGQAWNQVWSNSCCNLSLWQAAGATYGGAVAGGLTTLQYNFYRTALVNSNYFTGTTPQIVDYALQGFAGLAAGGTSLLPDFAANLFQKAFSPAPSPPTSSLPIDQWCRPPLNCDSSSTLSNANWPPPVTLANPLIYVPYEFYLPYDPWEYDPWESDFNW
jgi:RHS repeat-associated protein